MAQDTFLAKLQAGLLGRPNNPGGMLSDDDLKAAKQQAMLTMGAQLLSAGGPSSQPIGLGQALGGAMMAGQQAQAAHTDGTLQSMLLKSQIEKAQRQGNTVSKPMVVGAGGAVVDPTGKVLFTNPAGDQRASDLQIFDAVKAMSPEDRELFFQTKRNPTQDKLALINGGYVWADPTNHQITPISTSETEIRAAEQRKEAEARAAAVGTGQGNVEAGITKKGSEAVSTEATLDIAEPLIDVATGSGGGAARDQVAAFFGKSTTGADAIAQLRVLQASLMTSMPRMEGPQSDRDVDLYRQAAGQIGDPTVPNPQKKAAVQTIRQLQQRYKDRAAKQNGSQVKKRYNPETGKIE